MRFSGQVVVITGASSGIGATLARFLGEAGARLGLVALPGTGLEAVADEIRAKGATVHTAEADVGDKALFHEALERLTAELGPIDLLILNAGIGMETRAVGFSADDVEKLLRVNLLGVAYGIEAVLPSMIERKQGHIVGVSSLSSYRSGPFVSGYVASKAGVAAMLEGLRVELRALKTGVHVTTVRPGFVRTPMTTWVKRQNLLMDVEPAARIILKGIERKRPEIGFPASAVFFTNLLRILPCWLHDWLYCRVLQALAPEGPDGQRHGVLSAGPVVPATASSEASHEG